VRYEVFRQTHITAPIRQIRTGITWRAARMGVLPAHDDQNPSLDVRELADGRLLIICRAGCGSADIVDAVGLELSDLFPRDLKIAP